MASHANNEIKGYVDQKRFRTADHEVSPHRRAFLERQRKFCLCRLQMAPVTTELTVSVIASARSLATVWLGDVITAGFHYAARYRGTPPDEFLRLECPNHSLPRAKADVGLQAKCH